MKKLTIALLIFSVTGLVSSCKKDSAKPEKKGATVTIKNDLGYDLKALYVVGLKGTTQDDVAADTTASTRKNYSLGALAKGQQSGQVTVSGDFQSLAIVFTYHNDVMDGDYTAVVVKLSDGTNMLPYAFKPGEVKNFDLDKNTQIALGD